MVGLGNRQRQVESRDGEEWENLAIRRFFVRCKWEV